MVTHNTLLCFLRLLSGVLAFFLVAPDPLLAGGGAENLLLVVNADCPTSKMVANHYIRLRNLPPQNVVYLSNIPQPLRINLKTFEERILRPVVDYVRQAKLDKQIDYIVYSTGFPTTVDISEHQKMILEQVVKEQGKAAGDQFKNIFQPQASITSLTYFAIHILGNNPHYLGLESNQYFRKPAAALLENPFPQPWSDVYDSARQAISDNKVDDKVIKSLEDLYRQHPSQLAVCYLLAQAHAQLGDAPATATWLARAIRFGWCYRAKTKSDQAFAKVIGEPLISGLIDRIPDVPYDYVPTLGFSSSFLWAPNGGINNQPGSGMNYFLSTMLAVHAPFGMTERDILLYLQRSVNADYTKPRGQFLFAETGDVRTQTRKPFFDKTIAQLQALGADAAIVKAVYPKTGQLSGLQIGSSTFDPSASMAKLLPGAIADNLTSYGGDYTREGHTKLTELIKAGAAGSSGTVIEPYAIPQKFPHPMLHVHYRRGCSLGEAFYQAVAGPYQLLIVGDALCQPWAEPPKFELSGLEPLQSVSGNVEIKISTEDATRIDVIDVFMNGQLITRQPRLENFRFNSQQLPDGYHELRFVAVANTPIQTRASKSVPFRVNNANQSLTLSTTGDSFHIEETIEVAIESNLSGPVEIRSNSLKCGEIAGGAGKLSIPASLLGRGPVRLQAFVKAGEGKYHQSEPLELTIKGLVSDELPASGG